MERAIVKGRSYVNGESRDLVLVVYAAPATGGRARNRDTTLISDHGDTFSVDVGDFLDLALPDNVDA